MLFIRSRTGQNHFLSFCVFFFLVVSDFQNFSLDETRVCVCVSVCVCVASDSSETIKGINIKLGTVTASDMGMHHVVIMLTLTFIQGYTDLNHEINKYLVILKTVQAMPSTFAVTIVRQKICPVSV